MWNIPCGIYHVEYTMWNIPCGITTPSENVLKSWSYTFTV
jgi:hypothetical protein